MKIKIQNNLDNYDLDYERVQDDELLGNPAQCCGCHQEIPARSKVVTVPYTGKVYSALICLECADKIYLAFSSEKIPPTMRNSSPDGVWCCWCQNFSFYAANNVLIKNKPKFLCYSCNLPMNRMVLGIEVK